MLFIHDVIDLGGIETFYLRMAKEREKKGLSTSILLLKPEKYSNAQLLCEMRSYAKVYFLEYIFFTHSVLSHNFILLVPPKKGRIERLLESVDQIHASGGISLLVGQRLLLTTNKHLPITVGFYHYLEYLWGNNHIPYYVKKDRDFVFNYLPRQSILFFSEGNRILYQQKLKLNFDSSHSFRLGVIDIKDISPDYTNKEYINIVAVGRLVTFKSYNIFMLDVIRELIDKGYKIRLQIYGEGPLAELMTDKIQSLELQSYITLPGSLDYSKFDEIVSKADLFIGSGTAIIQAASLGVPSIIGIENIKEAKTYGYFSEVFQYEYNMVNSSLPLLQVSTLIENYINMNELDKINLKKEHIQSVNEFTNSSCQHQLNKLNEIRMPKLYYKFSPFLYEVSRFTSLVVAKINKNASFNKRYEDIKNI